MNDICTISTERLVLREIKESDTEWIVKWRSDPNVYQYFKNPHRLTIKEHLQWYRERYMRDFALINWIAHESDVPVGLFGAKKLDEEYAEISYLVSQEARHKGIAAEAVLGIEEWIKTKWEVTKIIAEIHRDNLPSIKFIQALGYSVHKKEGKFIIYCKKNKIL